MSDDKFREDVKDFFEIPFPVPDIRAILIGTGLLLLGVIFWSGCSMIFGLLLCVTGLSIGIFFPIVSRPKASVDQYSAPERHFNLVQLSEAKRRFENLPEINIIRRYRQDAFEDIERKSLERLGLDESQVTGKAILVAGPLFFRQVSGIDRSLVRRRAITGSEKYMYSTYRVTVFHFTDSFLAAYSSDYNLTKDVAVNESTDEFFYKDIVAVKTVTELSNYTLDVGEVREHSKLFKLTASSGDSIEVTLNSPRISVEDEIVSKGERAVANIRTMLREYKGASA